MSWTFNPTCETRSNGVRLRIWDLLERMKTPMFQRGLNLAIRGENYSAKCPNNLENHGPTSWSVERRWNGWSTLWLDNSTVPWLMSCMQKKKVDPSGTLDLYLLTTSEFSPEMHGSSIKIHTKFCLTLVHSFSWNNQIWFAHCPWIKNSDTKIVLWHGKVV